MTADMANMLAALDVPVSAGALDQMEGLRDKEVCRAGHRLITDDIARDLWLQWNPAQAAAIERGPFLAHFRKFLADGMELGYRLGRFRDVSARLPALNYQVRDWIPLFEDAIAGEDCCRVRLYLSHEQHQAFQSVNRMPDDSGVWEQKLSMMTDGMFWELGLVFPPLEVLTDDSLSPPWFRCQWNDFRLPPQRGLDDQTVMVNDTPERLRLLGIEGTPAVNPSNDQACAVVHQSYAERAEQAGLTVWDAQGFVVLVVSAAIRQGGAGLVNRSLGDLYLLRLRDFTPDAVSVLDGALEPDFLVQVLRGLLAEEISIRDLSRILQSVLELRAIADVDLGKYIVFPAATGGTFAGATVQRVSDLVPADYVEFVRWSLKRYISHKYTRGQNTLIVYLVDPEAESLLAKSEWPGAAADSAIRKAVREEVGSLPPTAQNPVILTSTAVRRKLRRMLVHEFPRLAVLSYQELSPDMNIQPLARISPDFG
jgi:type III secretion protein V